MTRDKDNTMHKDGVEGFDYYLGLDSLKNAATKDDRVCVFNILGNESRGVTPTSHEFSGGNIAFGVGPGKSGQKLKTKIGDIPVYNSVKEGIEAGHKFNTAVIYLPPSGVKDAVAEAVKHNPGLEKVIILTEKVSIRDSRIIRAICQTNGIDAYGANCLGVADSWNKVRLGGALGGNNPEESLVKGSVGLFSNSGNFTTTIAVYLLTQGWGTTVSISSGKDVYINYGPKEFMHALDNDDRSKCAVLYAEPGGYYEYDLKINKPTVACVVGRWKAKLTKACGHAGSLAGSGDNAIAKEKWFMDNFGVDDIFTPENPVVSKKGAVVTNIAHIPEALTAVMKLNGQEPDFKPQGDLSLKCWFGNNNGVNVPKDLDVPSVKAVEPYNEQIDNINKFVGAQFARQPMKDTSGVSMMDPKTQITKINNFSLLECSEKSLEENLVMSVIKKYPGSTSTALANIALNSYVNFHGDSAMAAAQASREAGNSPNTVLSSAVSIIGKGRVETALKVSETLVETFAHAGIKCYGDKYDFKAELSKADKSLYVADGSDTCAETALKAIAGLDRKSVFIDFVTEAAGGKPSMQALLGAIWTSIGWSALMEKKISKITMNKLPWYSMVWSAFVGCSVTPDKVTEDSFCGEKVSDLVTSSYTETAFLALIGRKPNADELFEFSMLLGLIISNGPGTISAQGCKGAVSADGPGEPGRVQINKGFIGFLTHTGFAHGGNGYEAVEFLMNQFKESGLKDASNAEHNLDLKKLSMDYAQKFVDYKKQQKALGNLEYAKVPCVNHPVFKGDAVNYDPRERFVAELFGKKKIYNVFLDFYQNLVQSLFDTKASKNVYCVNVDAVIAVILLKIVWSDYAAGNIKESDVESSGFTTFLFGRMIGCAAEIDDHINRGRNMDTRTAASKTSFV